jgi:hypothetical protein
VTGRVSHKFDLFAANMAVARAVRIVAGDPRKQAAMIEELHRFFTKFAETTAGELRLLR